MAVYYLCGPISLNGSLSPDAVKKNIERFLSLRIEVEERGDTALDPTMLPKQTGWADYMRLTIPLVCRADYILVLPGWEMSRGAIFEILVAHTCGIPVQFP